MNIRSIVFAIVLVLLSAAPAADPAKTLRPYLFNGQWGYIDTDGNVAQTVPPVFEAATDFSPSGLAMVRENGVTRCIDAGGGTVVKESGATPPTLVNARGETVWPK